MRILYVLQQSIYNKKNGVNKWMSADSNINMFVGLAKELLAKTTWKIDVLISPLSDFGDLMSYNELIVDSRVRFIPIRGPIDPFLSRQHFDANVWSILLENNYDVIINCMPEISRNIRTIIETQLKNKPKLITQCFWMDCPEIGEPKVPTAFSYDYRQFDGYECSDLCAFTCFSTRTAFFNNASLKFSVKNSERIWDKSTIWDLGYSENECKKYWYPHYDRATKKRILFLNRLSEINYTHHEEFIAAIKEISKSRDDFEVVFTNPSRKIDIASLGIPKVVTPYSDKPLTREEYWKLLHSAYISVHLFTVERYGGCALRESIAAENIPIVADCFEQALLVDNTDLKVKVIGKNEISIPHLIDRLNFVLDGNVSISELERIRKANYKNCSFESVSSKIIDDIQTVVKK